MNVQHSKHWLPISTAKKDGSVVLVNNTNLKCCNSPWVAAKWIQRGTWKGWVCCDVFFGGIGPWVSDESGAPIGPNPTLWFDLPDLPIPLE